VNLTVTTTEVQIRRSPGGVRPELPILLKTILG